jgi:hypothetical protein
LIESVGLPTKETMSTNAMILHMNSLSRIDHEEEHPDDNEERIFLVIQLATNLP